MASIDISDTFQPVVLSVLADKPDWPENCVVCAEELEESLEELTEEDRLLVRAAVVSAEDLRLDPAELREMTEQAANEEALRLVRLWLNKLKRFRFVGCAMVPELGENLLPVGCSVTPEDVEPFDFLTVEDVEVVLRTLAGIPEKREALIRAALAYLVL